MRVGRQPDAPYVTFSGERCAAFEGFTLHAGVQIDGRARDALERLVRYVARPAIATERLTLLPDGRVRYRLRKPWQDGTRAVDFDPLTFLEKLCALVPPPRAHRVSYHGVLGPNAELRPAVVLGKAHPARPRWCPVDDDDNEAERKRRYTWAELMRRVFSIDVLRCECGGRRRVIALITDPPVIRAILECLDLAAQPPPIHPPRWPP